MNYAINRVRRTVMRPVHQFYESLLDLEVRRGLKPQHLGIVLDGNRRFARQNRMSHVVKGHQYGAEKLWEMLRWSHDMGIRVITIWIFSLDNFNREEDEVNGLFKLIEDKTLAWLKDPEIYEKRVRFRYSGRTELLPDSLQAAIRKAEEETAEHNDFILNIAIAYGGREEITDAFRRYMEEGQEKGLSLEEMKENISPEELGQHMYTSGLPEPDLIIRTSGELRLSGFLLWQSAYSEYYFTDVLWPDFRRIDFLRALRSYNKRKRRFGK
ncbi:MAG: di-trans,poly-cis-decaprenylcistransferase [Deltaproteobacteria bacterium]|nr:MAG: di-trans,poly-cis-decaprenylcistransferase [Deltaproteobacteria bacterium]